MPFEIELAQVKRLAAIPECAADFAANTRALVGMLRKMVRDGKTAQSRT